MNPPRPTGGPAMRPQTSPWAWWVLPVRMSPGVDLYADYACTGARRCGCMRHAVRHQHSTLNDPGALPLISCLMRVGLTETCMHQLRLLIHTIYWQYVEVQAAVCCSLL